MAGYLFKIETEKKYRKVTKSEGVSNNPPSSHTDMSLHVRQKFNVSITSGLLPHPCDICD